MNPKTPPLSENRRAFGPSAVLVPLLFILVFIAFVVINEKWEERNRAKSVEERARVVSVFLWDFDYRPADEYLRVASELEHYENFIVVDADGDVFISMECHKPHGLDGFLSKIGLIRVNEICHAIEYGNKQIGEIRVRFYNRSIYLYLEFFVFLLLFYFAAMFFLDTIEAKKNLEVRVKERTAGLVRLNAELENARNEIANKAQEMVFLNKELEVSNRELQTRSEELESINEELSMSNEELGRTSKELEKAKTECENWGKDMEVKVNEKTKDLMKIQEQLARSEKLAVLGKLAGSLSHELRNPLSSIKNAVYYLTMPNKERDKKAIDEYLEIIKRQAEIMNKIIHDSLDFARPKAPEPRRCGICDTIREALAEIRIPENIVVDVKCDEKIEMFIDPFQIRQAFVNILTNSIQAIHSACCAGMDGAKDGGVIEITAQKDGDFAKIVFRDNGEGMTKETTEKIYEPLFTTRVRGVGLGMAIVKGIIEKHKGSIDVESEFSKGTVITLRLPV